MTGAWMGDYYDRSLDGTQEVIMTGGYHDGRLL